MMDDFFKAWLSETRTVYGARAALQRLRPNVIAALRAWKFINACHPETGDICSRAHLKTELVAYLASLWSCGRGIYIPDDGDMIGSIDAALYQSDAAAAPAMMEYLPFATLTLALTVLNDHLGHTESEQLLRTRARAVALNFTWLLVIPPCQHHTHTQQWHAARQAWARLSLWNLRELLESDDLYVPDELYVVWLIEIWWLARGHSKVAPADLVAAYAAVLQQCLRAPLLNEETVDSLCSQLQWMRGFIRYDAPSLEEAARRGSGIPRFMRPRSRSKILNVDFLCTTTTRCVRIQCGPACTFALAYVDEKNAI